MARPPKIAQDERYHYEIWSGETEAHKKQNPSISYVENHNADWDYDLAADDYKMATDLLIKAQLNDPSLANWTAPVCHLIRQSIELQLKSLLNLIGLHTNTKEDGLSFTHNLHDLWEKGRQWLIANDYQIKNDARLKFADRLIENLHAIDPSGDLFRFGTSKFYAFDRNKTYDRVGYEQKLLFNEFEQAFSCIGHWGAVLMREIICREMDWSEDPMFNADDFPRELGDN